MRTVNAFVTVLLGRSSNIANISPVKIGSTIMTARLSGKVALISGGASGIGAAHAEVFAAEGAQVVIGDLQKQLGRSVSEKIQKSGGQAEFIHLDVTVEEAWKNAVQKTVGMYGKLTTLINNAGVYWPAGIEA